MKLSDVGEGAERNLASQEKAQSTLRVTMAAFWRTFHHDGIISPGW